MSVFCVTMQKKLYMQYFISFWAISCLFLLAASPKALSTKLTHWPSFNSDSAYLFIEQQIEFGPRVPNTPAHQACKKYLKKKLLQAGAMVFMQHFKAQSFHGTSLKLTNIIASFQPTCKDRILLAAHWDTRPFADKDTLAMYQPFSGANDGASGVGVLLEIARLIGETPHLSIGIDIIFFDGEDYGAPMNDPRSHQNHWCLGAQWWSNHKHVKNYKPCYGILLDMVGGKEATFYQEGFSLQYAPKVMAEIWNTAIEIGYPHFFIAKPSGQYIIDDHYFVNTLGNIPMVNIIDHHANSKSCFKDYHHTHADNLLLIDKPTLKAVGDTLWSMINKKCGLTKLNSHARA